jgi:serine protease
MAPRDRTARSDGTHCAGVAAGATLGVAPLATLHALRVLDCRGSGLSSNVVRALEYAAAHPARIKIASISLGGSFSAIENRAVDSAVLLGLTVVVAAGTRARAVT